MNECTNLKFSPIAIESLQTRGKKSLIIDLAEATRSCVQRSAGHFAIVAVLVGR